MFDFSKKNDLSKKNAIMKRLNDYPNRTSMAQNSDLMIDYLRFRFLYFLYLFGAFSLLSNNVSGQENNAFFDAKLTIDKGTKSTFSSNIHVPFKVNEGMIVVDAFVNDRKGKFIIDTGAPTLILNQKPIKKQLLGRGISTELAVGEIQVEDFSWANIEKNNLTALSVDINHLQTNLGTPIAGIIGYDILKEVELLVDYATKTIQLNSVKGKAADNSQPIAIIPFKMQGHLPVIKVKIGNKKLRLALDTASESNILDTKDFEEFLSSSVGKTQKKEIQGIDHQIQEAIAMDLEALEVSGIMLEKMEYLFTDLSHLKSKGNLFVDGLLGYPFFKQGQLSINYKRKKIYIWSLNNRLAPK